MSGLLPRWHRATSAAVPSQVDQNRAQYRFVIVRLYLAAIDSQVGVWFPFGYTAADGGMCRERQLDPWVQLARRARSSRLTAPNP